MKSKDEILEMVRRKIRLRHLALSTEDAYLGWISRYYVFSKRLPASLAPERKAEAFLTSLAVERGVAARTQNQALAALLFLYGSVLGRPLGNVAPLRAKRPQLERTAPSKEQIRLFRSAVRDRPWTPAKLLVDLIYGVGLRVSEPLNLRMRDVALGEGLLVIRGAKGGKDRKVPIPRPCLESLKIQMEHATNAWRLDRENAPLVGVPLPDRLEAKYPSAPLSLQWFWVFPAAGHCKDPYSGRTVRFHILIDSLQRAVQEAATRVQLNGLITAHVLRHAYATHMLASGLDVKTLSEIMGHNSLETTAGYLHSNVARAASPLEFL